MLNYLLNERLPCLVTYREICLRGGEGIICQVVCTRGGITSPHCLLLGLLHPDGRRARGTVVSDTLAAGKSVCRRRRGLAAWREAGSRARVRRQGQGAKARGQGQEAGASRQGQGPEPRARRQGQGPEPRARVRARSQGQEA